LNKHLFIIGLPGSDKLNCLLQKINSGKIKARVQENNNGKEKRDEIKLSHKQEISDNVYIADLIHISEPEKKGDESKDVKVWHSSFIHTTHSAKKSNKQK
jgi:hypothetical protein